MISSLKGSIIETSADSLVVEMGGLGLKAFVPQPLALESSVGQQIALQTYLHVRENELSLYGFADGEQRNLFLHLLGVNGVGPKLALAILSTLSAEAIRAAVTTDQSAVLNQVSGVGKKTAQKIVLHLADRLEPVESGSVASNLLQQDAELLEALASLGYTVIESQAAIQSLPTDAPAALEDRIRLALAYFNSPQ
jgi:Holliday junction DNA helicase RuvA